MSHHSHDHHHKKRVLFLLKENSYGNFGIAKSGLLNSVRLLVKALEQFVEEFKISVCVDANNIDREVWLFKPDICFIEAIWVTGKKLAEIKRLHPKVIFIIRIHSNIPFLAMEGSAIERLKEYNELQGVFISFNNKFTNDYFGWLFIPIYLPNLYIDSNIMTCIEEKKHVNIGCFGSIRPFKNQLLQAVAAINYGYNNDQIVHFHINYSRVEQQGDSVLKNIRSLFNGTVHKLIEHRWMSHDDFLAVVSKMDLGLQVSVTESFNIVTADFISTHIPIIVSKDIYWMPPMLKVESNDAKELELKIKDVLENKHKFIRKQSSALQRYNNEALEVWRNFLS